MTVTPEGLRELQDVLALLEKATAFDVETAEHRDIGLHDCPLCQGEGAVEGTTYTNFDRVATGVQFFGVGNEHEHLERAVLAAYHFMREHGASLATPQRVEAGWAVEDEAIFKCPECGYEDRRFLSGDRCRICGEELEPPSVSQPESAQSTPPTASSAAAGAVGYVYLHKPSRQECANLGAPEQFLRDNRSCEFVRWLYDAPPSASSTAGEAVEVIAEVVGEIRDGAIQWCVDGGGLGIPDGVEVWIIPDIGPVDGCATLYTKPSASSSASSSAPINPDVVNSKLMGSAAAEAVDGWQPMETAPRDGAIIVCRYEHHPVRPAMFDGEAWVTWGAVTESGPEPIGWRALTTQREGRADG